MKKGMLLLSMISFMLISVSINAQNNKQCTPGCCSPAQCAELIKSGKCTPDQIKKCQSTKMCVPGVDKSTDKVNSFAISTHNQFEFDNNSLCRSVCDKRKIGVEALTTVLTYVLPLKKIELL